MPAARRRLSQAQGTAVAGGKICGEISGFRIGPLTRAVRNDRSVGLAPRNVGQFTSSAAAVSSRSTSANSSFCELMPRR